MTAATRSQAALWAVPDRTDQTRQLRPSPTCALCATAPPATPLGLCAGCLAAAAAEYDIAVMPSDRRLAAVPACDLCRRCGSSKHPTRGCPV
jgi:hypothetical protein